MKNKHPWSGGPFGQCLHLIVTNILFAGANDEPNTGKKLSSVSSFEVSISVHFSSVDQAPFFLSHILLPSRRGRIGFLTNIFTGGVNNPVAAGRGFLILDWLRGQLSAQEYLQVCSNIGVIAGM